MLKLVSLWCQDMAGQDTFHW